MTARITSAAAASPARVAAPAVRTPKRDSRGVFATRARAILDQVGLARRTGYYLYEPVLEDVSGRHVVIGGRKLINLAGYQYLGMAHEPEIREAAASAGAEFGTGVLGSRVLCGSTTVHKELEAALAAFLGREAALVFNTGYTTNVATVSAILAPGDTAIMDEYVHASLVDGVVLSGARRRIFRHNNIADLRRRLADADSELVLVVIDGVYSMEGDVAPLDEIAAACRDHGAMLMVDEAHSIGVLGATGRGITELFGNAASPDLVMGTLSKAFGATGGFIAGDAGMIDYLRHSARGYVFSAALAPSQAAAALTSLHMLKRNPSLLRAIDRNQRAFREGMKEAGFRVHGADTPIVPIGVGDLVATVGFAKRVIEDGVFTVPAIYPAVPMNAPRIRNTITCSLTPDDIAEAVEIFTTAARGMGLIAD